MSAMVIIHVLGWEEWCVVADSFAGLSEALRWPSWLVAFGHTYWLQSHANTLTFLLGNRLMRVMVPAFCIVAGFFPLLSAAARGKGGQVAVAGDGAYIFWMAIYLPFWLNEVHDLVSLVKTLLLGFFHLWFMAGIIVAGVMILGLRWLSRVIGLGTRCRSCRRRRGLRGGGRGDAICQPVGPCPDRRAQVRERHLHVFLRRHRLPAAAASGAGRAAGAARAFGGAGRIGGRDCPAAGRSVAGSGALGRVGHAGCSR